MSFKEEVESEPRSFMQLKAGVDRVLKRPPGAPFQLSTPSLTALTARLGVWNNFGQLPARAIEFTGPNVLEILADRKTQTRRVLVAKHLDQVDRFAFWPERGEWEMGETHQGPVASCGFVRCPFGVPGDKLWVREGWGVALSSGAGWADGGATLTYRADGDQVPLLKSRFDLPATVGQLKNWRAAWRSPRFMPRWASRVYLELTDVRVERLQDISEADAKAEGVKPAVYDPEGDCWTATERARLTPHVVAYEYLWGEIHGFDSWQKNPWVWVLSFKRVSP